MEQTNHNNDRTLALLNRARFYCATEEHCTSAVESKLRDWNTDEESIEYIINQLQQESFLDDNRYARQYCESKILRHHWGRIKIINHLRLKHISHNTIQQALDSIPPEQYIHALEEAAEKKLRTDGHRWGPPNNQRNKLFAYLAGCGFTTDEIIQVINNKLPS